ncbi:MAG: redoxin domain-containing protein [Hyphomonadaceae bacterium]|nr:redoxin domain-containing protein [Hyphomonadaceae bacterium]
MNKQNLLLIGGMAAAVCLTVGAMIASTAQGETPALVTGAEAPGFTGLTSTGETISLSDFAGQRVVLEWTNHDCPFVRKHYDGEHTNMQSQQLAANAEDIVWLTIISSAPGKQGHVTPDMANELTTSRGAAPDHVILDESGDIGRAYDAKTTPHMYIIEPDGTLAYQGAIDSIPSARTRDIPTALQYVNAALDSLAAGEEPEVDSSKAYGCSVKY